MPEVRLTVTKCTIGGDWLVEDRDHIIAIFAAWNPAIRFAHDHATLRAGHRRTPRAEYHAHKRRWQELIDAINSTSRTQP